MLTPEEAKSACMCPAPGDGTITYYYVSGDGSGPVMLSDPVSCGENCDDPAILPNLENIMQNTDYFICWGCEYVSASDAVSFDGLLPPIT